MSTRQKLTFSIASIIFAALQPVGATAQGASAPVGLRHSQAVQAAAEGANQASQEADAKLVMLKLLPDLPGKEVVIMTVTYPPGTLVRFTDIMQRDSSTSWKALSSWV